MSSINNDRQKQATDIKKLQEQYQQRRKEIIEQNESNLSELKRDYKEKEDSVRKSGEAVINHIKKNTKQREQQLIDKQNRQLAQMNYSHRNQYKSHLLIMHKVETTRLFYL